MTATTTAKKPLTVLYWYGGATGYGGIEASLGTFLNSYDRARVRPIFVWAGLKKIAQLSREIDATGTEQIELLPPIGARGDRLRRAAATFALLRRLRPDILHIHSSGAITHGALLAIASVLRIRVVRTVHMPFSRCALNAGYRHHRSRHRFLASTVARFIAVSRADRAELIETGLVKRERCVIIHNGTRLDRFRDLPDIALAKQRLGVDPAHPIIGLVGRITLQKQFDRVIGAMPALLADHPAAKLIIVGDVGQAGALHAQVAALGLSQSVIFLGYRDDVPLCLAALDIFAVPSLFESQGLVIQEGMAAGRPIVASPLDCFLEMVGENGPAKLVDVHNRALLASTLSALLSNPDERARMGALGLERAKAFSGELHAARTQDLYDEVLRDPHLPDPAHSDLAGDQK